MNELNLVTPLHTATKRDYLARANDDKIHCSEVARLYGPDYWDGHRRYGYGGYRYDGRWKPVAERLIAYYGLTNQSRILDMGCGKAHLLHEIKLLLPSAEVVGVDHSSYGLNDAPEPIRSSLRYGKAEEPYQFGFQAFDLAISLGCFHNLRTFELRRALSELARVSRRQYITVESFRSVAELENLKNWALTCNAFFCRDEWIDWFQQYCPADYELIYFE